MEVASGMDLLLQTLLPLLIEMLCPNAPLCLYFCGCFYALQPNVSNFLVFCHILSLLVCIWLLFEFGILVTFHFFLL